MNHDKADALVSAYHAIHVRKPRREDKPFVHSQCACGVRRMGLGYRSPGSYIGDELFCGRADCQLRYQATLTAARLLESQ